MGRFDEAVADGDLRRFRVDGRRSVERVTALEPNRYAYELVSGLPLRNYRAEVTFTPRPDGGTDIRWHSVIGLAPNVFYGTGLSPEASNLIERSRYRQGDSPSQG